MTGSSRRSSFVLKGAIGIGRLPATVTPATDPAAFSMTGARWSFDDVTLVDCVQTAFTSAITLVPDAGPDTVTAAFVRSGDFTVHHAGRQLRFLEGSVAYFTGEAEVRVASTVDTHLTIVSIPRTRLTEQNVVLANTFGSFAYSTARRSPILSFLSALIDIVQNHSIPAEPTASVVAQLVGALFLEDENYHLRANQHDLGLRAQAESLIALGSADTSFRAHSLATQLDISLRQLEKNFVSTSVGTTPTDAIRDRRIMMAMLGMQSPAENHRTSAEVAEQAGFSSVRELGRALKNAYGLTVKEVLLSQIADSTLTSGRQQQRAAE
ncbi:helix-turn-helix domain-containing protein [Subtercola vilae]|uniref:AraC family transcriptional regulator n=1 Tax=Subtercola vilae TaxID=2056433 RepID=A0A4T2C1Y8_9MICO|nr:helix-turn-helix domain-containing protein [Subtercola vilae]TIH37111.1 AraC family transcriptional regulator [Subtercola vilae]